MRETKMCALCYFWEQYLEDRRYGTCVSMCSRYGGTIKKYHIYCKAFTKKDFMMDINKSEEINEL